MQTAGPYSVVAGEVTTLTPPDDQAYAWVVVFNSIDYELKLSYAGNQQWIEASMANSYKLDNPSIVMTAQPITTQADGTSLGEIKAVWYLTNEPPPMGYPIPITATSVTYPSGTPVTVTGQPISVDVVSTATVATTKASQATVTTAATNIYSNTSGATQFCSALIIANAQTVVVTVTISLADENITVVVPAGNTTTVPIAQPYEIVNNQSITGTASTGSVTVSALTTG